MRLLLRAGSFRENIRIRGFCRNIQRRLKELSGVAPAALGCMEKGHKDFTGVQTAFRLCPKLPARAITNGRSARMHVIGDKDPLIKPSCHPYWESWGKTGAARRRTHKEYLLDAVDAEEQLKTFRGRAAPGRGRRRRLGLRGLSRQSGKTPRIPDNQ